MTIRTEERVSHLEGGYAYMAAKSDVAESEKRMIQLIADARMERLEAERREI